MGHSFRRWVFFLGVWLCGCSVGGSNVDKRGTSGASGANGVATDGSGGGGFRVAPGVRGSCDGGSTVTIKSLEPGLHTQGVSGGDDFRTDVEPRLHEDAQAFIGHGGLIVDEQKRNWATYAPGFRHNLPADRRDTAPASNSRR